MKTLLSSFLIVVSFSAWSYKTPLPQNKMNLGDMTQRQLSQALTRHYIHGDLDEDSVKDVTTFLGIEVHSSVDGLPVELRLSSMIDALDSYTRIPLYMLQKISKNKKGLGFVAGKLTNHPMLADLGGVQPRGWPEGSSWDTVPGVGATNDHGAYVVVDSLHAGHGSLDLVLHEIGHSFDRYYTGERNLQGRFLSVQTIFQDIMTKTPFTTMYAEHRIAYLQEKEENFAEMFTMYFHSVESRAQLLKDFPEGHAYFAKTFPDSPSLLNN